MDRPRDLGLPRPPIVGVLRTDEVVVLADRRANPQGVLGDVSAERTVGPIDVVVVTAVDGHRELGVGDKHGLRAASGANRVGDRDEHDDLPSLPFEHARG